jgi:hypothetical protein
MPDLAKPIFYSSLFGRGSAVFSKCQTYRYRLDRLWDESLPPLAFGMLNPSTADHERNDATIERCERRARALGFGSLVVWNLFAFRATHPTLLKTQPDPVGPQNDDFIREALLETKNCRGTVIVGWGANGSFKGRHIQISEIARNFGVELHCLGVTSTRQPKHPLYVSYQSKPTPWNEVESRRELCAGVYEGPNAAAAFDSKDLMPS